MTLNGLQLSVCRNIFITLKYVGLEASIHNPFVYMAALNRGAAQYILVYTSTTLSTLANTNTVKEQILSFFSLMIQVYWQDDVDWFLGTALTWSTEPQGNLYVHI